MFHLHFHPKNLFCFFQQGSVEAEKNDVTGTFPLTTPLMVAAEFRATDVVKLLKQHRADVNKLNSKNRCAMTFALAAKDQDLTEELLPTVIPAGLGIQTIWSSVAEYKPMMSNPIENFIQQAIDSGWCLETSKIFVKFFCSKSFFKDRTRIFIHCHLKCL